MTVGAYDKKRPAGAVSPVHTLCHAPFTVMDLGPQGQVTTCNHFHRFIGNLHSQSWLDIFRGEDWSRLRANMLDYRVSEMDCRHCARQIRSGHPGNAFAQEHFDSYPATTANPKYPTVIIFRLSNHCNLMCVMCNGTLSHRIRKERENLPPLPPPPYDEKFFAEMEETLPHVRYVEFYGGEPFLVKEHIRILDIIEKTGSKTEIYVNTNGTAITPKIKGYIERLNFIKIAVSVDAIYEGIHARQRVGIKHDVCMENLGWLLELRNRKSLWVGLNTTETRFNWYHLPVMYQWAAGKDVYIHINTCLHPSDTTLYDLPTEELTYIGDFYARWRQRLGKALDVRGNGQSFGHLEAMVRDELAARVRGTRRPNPYPTDRDPMYGGLMWVPELTAPPISTVEEARVEIAKVQEFCAWDYAHRMACTWLDALETAGGPWRALRGELEALRDKAAPLAVEFTRRRADERLGKVVRDAWKLERQGRFDVMLDTLAAVPPESEHFREAQLLKARGNRRIGCFDTARSLLEQLLDAQPTDPGVRVELAWLASDMNDPQAGLDHARKARDLTGDDAERDKIASWAHALASLALRVGDRGEATEAVRRLEQVLPNAQFTLELRDAVDRFDVTRDRMAVDTAWKLERAGRYADAIAAVAGIAPTSEVFYDAQIPIARAMRRKGDVSGAREVLRKAIERTPERSEAYVESAWLAYDQGDPDAGVAAAQRAGDRVQTGPAVPWLHALAVTSLAAGRFDLAAGALARIHAEKGRIPESAIAGGARTAEREALGRGWASLQSGDLAAASTSAGAVGEGSPLRFAAHALRSRIHLRRGDSRSAWRTLAYSIAVEPTQLEALIEIAWQRFECADHANAIRFATLARDLSATAGNPLGVVGWAHPLLLAASASGEAKLADEVAAELGRVRDSESLAGEILAHVRR